MRESLAETSERAALFLAVRAGDGIRTREYLLGNRATLRSPAPLAFP